MGYWIHVRDFSKWREPILKFGSTLRDVFARHLDIQINVVDEKEVVNRLNAN